METADADEIIVPLCIIIICAGLHQLRGQVVKMEDLGETMDPQEKHLWSISALLKELSNEDQKGYKNFLSQNCLQT